MGSDRQIRYKINRLLRSTCKEILGWYNNKYKQRDQATQGNKVKIEALSPATY